MLGNNDVADATSCGGTPGSSVTCRAGWSGRGVGLAPAGKRRLLAAHTSSGHSVGVAVGGKLPFATNREAGPWRSIAPQRHFSLVKVSLWAQFQRR